MKNFRVSTRQRGFSLLEVMVVVGIMSIVGLSVMTLISNQSKGVMALRIAASRDELFNQLIRYAGSVDALRSSTYDTANGSYRNCVNGALGEHGTPIPTACTPINQGFYLSEITNTTTAKRISGTPASPLRYDINGHACEIQVASPSCPLEVTSTFTAHCGASMSPCSIATSIEIFITVQQADGIKLSAGPNLGPKTSLGIVSRIPLTSTALSGTQNRITLWTTDSTIGSSRYLNEMSGKGVSVGPSILDPDVAGKIPAMTIQGRAEQGLVLKAENGLAASLSIEPKNNGSTEFYDYNGGHWNFNFVLAGGNAAFNNSISANQNISAMKLIYAKEALGTEGSVSGAAFYYTSDQRLKTNIETLPHAIEKLRQLRGVLFNWKKDGRADVGLIAQEVEKVYPELVHTDAKTGFKSVEYANLVALLVEALKNQDARLQQMDDRLQKIEQNIEERTSN